MPSSAGGIASPSFPTTGACSHHTSKTWSVTASESSIRPATNRSKTTWRSTAASSTWRSSRGPTWPHGTWPTVGNSPREARIVFDTVDLCFLREDRQARLDGDPEVRASAASRKEQELRLARHADLTLVVSPIEKAVLEQECPTEVDVSVLSNIFPPSTASPPDHGTTPGHRVHRRL